MSWASDYVGLPFADGGRTRDGCDCWGLVRLVLAEQCGFEVPSYAGISARDTGRVAAEFRHGIETGGWREIDRKAVEAFDVVVMRGVVRAGGEVGIGEVHAGIAVDGKRLLHVEEGKNAVLVRLKSPTVAHRISRVFRSVQPCS